MFSASVFIMGPQVEVGALRSDRTSRHRANRRRSALIISNPKVQLRARGHRRSRLRPASSMWPSPHRAPREHLAPSHSCISSAQTWKIPYRGTGLALPTSFRQRSAHGRGHDYSVVGKTGRVRAYAVTSRQRTSLRRKSRRRGGRHAKWSFHPGRGLGPPAAGRYHAELQLRRSSRPLSCQPARAWPHHHVHGDAELKPSSRRSPNGARIVAARAVSRSDDRRWDKRCVVGPAVSGGGSLEWALSLGLPIGDRIRMGAGYVRLRFHYPDGLGPPVLVRGVLRGGARVTDCTRPVSAVVASALFGSRSN
jgi:hypothetical protein